MHHLAPLVFFLAVLLSAAAVPKGGKDDWPQFRGPERSGISPGVPRELPEKKLIWQQPLSGQTYAGVVVAGQYVLVPDHGEGKDFLRCYRADSGKPVWTHSYANAKEMDFGASPRATPLVYEERVYTLGAFGDLYCLELVTGKVVWHLNLAQTFQARVPKWGYSASPLMVDGKLIVNPGSKEAGLVALDPKTGATIWQTPGDVAAYASFIAGAFGGVQQIVGFDAGSLGGWDPATGKRLWSVVPENASDYNVGTPVDVGGKILVSTDANYTRLYAFREGGEIIQKPVAVNEDLAPDTATPVFINGLIFGPTHGLVCLDVNDGLKLRWQHRREEALTGFFTIIAGNDRLLVFTESGTLFLVAVDREKPQVLGSMKVSEQTWSHPALAGGRLYIRDDKMLYCYDFGDG